MARNKKTVIENAIPMSAAEMGTDVIPHSINFDELEGETYAGINVIRLKPSEVAGPIIITQIERQVKLGSNATFKPVDVYIGKLGKIEVHLPVSASFISKAN